MNTKRLTEGAFLRAIVGLSLATKTVEIVRAVLVDGQRQADVAAVHGLTRGAVSQAVTKVWDASQIPPGYERVEAVLPAMQAFQVKQWAKAAERKLNK